MVGATKVKREQPPCSQLEKTKWCKFHIQGRCTKGSLCPFAHNLDELREQPNLRQTKLCKVLIQTGQCNNPSCTYAHDKDELRYSSAFTSYKTKFCRFMESGTCSLGAKCNFAHSPVELRAALLAESGSMNFAHEAALEMPDFGLAWNPSIAPPPGLSMESVFSAATSPMKASCEASSFNLGGASKMGVAVCAPEDQFSPAYVQIESAPEPFKFGSMTKGFESEGFLDVLVDQIRQAQIESNYNLASLSTLSSFPPLDEASPASSTPSESGGGDASFSDGSSGNTSFNSKSTMILANEASLKLSALYSNLKSDMA